MKLVFDDRAPADLEVIYDWFAQDSPKAVVDRVFASSELLASFPYLSPAPQQQ